LAAPFGGRQRVFGAPADHFPLFLGNYRHDVHGDPVRVRHIGRDEVHAGLLQPEQEVRVAGQSIQLGDNELGAEHPAGLDGLGQHWPVGVFAALDLDKFLHQRPVAAIQVISNRAALRLDRLSRDAHFLLGLENSLDRGRRVVDGRRQRLDGDVDQ